MMLPIVSASIFQSYQIVNYVVPILYFKAGPGSEI